MPERPMAAMKSADKKRTKAVRFLLGMHQRTAITFWKNLQPGFLQVGTKSPHDGPKGRQVDLFEIGSRAAELLEQAQEMIWSAADRNRGETLGFREFRV